VNYLLDTNVVIAVIRRQPVIVRNRLHDASDAGDLVAISSVVLFELWYGVAKSQRRRENSERLRIFLSGNVGIQQFDEDDATVAGELRATLELARTPIRSYDLLIAAQAVRSSAVLITANVSEFSRVPGLTWENWASTSS
jgi:tRNA(fMet)-specific endonuclease VapC